MIECHALRPRGPRSRGSLDENDARFQARGREPISMDDGLSYQGSSPATPSPPPTPAATPFASSLLFLRFRRNRVVQRGSASLED